MLARLMRRSSLFTLPLVVLIGFGLVAGLAAWQRSDVIAELADQIAHGEKAEATAAVRQLATIPNPPLSVLVEAAAADEPPTAEAAQAAISRLLGQWKQQLARQQRVGSVASHLTELATELAAHRNAFAPADYPWLASTARKIVRLANQCPPKKTPFVAVHCDEVLSATASTTAAEAPRPGGESPAENVVRREVPSSGDSLPDTETTQERLEREFAEFPIQPIATGPNADAERRPVHVPPPAPTENEVESKPAETPPADVQLDSARLPSGLPSTDDVLTALPEMSRPPEKLPVPPSWELPMFRLPPELSATPLAAESGTTPNQSTAPAPKSAPQVAEQLGTRQIMERWLSAQASQRPAWEQLLAARGFRPLPTKLVQQYLSADIEDRLRVVDLVLTLASVDPRPWLFLLAEDENAEVRLLAVTVMATSDDPALMEKAWQVALRDRDPRIADLASRLRDRRAAARRR